MSQAVIVTAALIRRGRVLMVHRHPSRRWYPDCWDLPGGHVESGESLEEALTRECTEELDVRICDPRPIPMTIADPALELHAFLVDRWDGDPVNAAPDEHDGLEWFTPAQLGGLILAHPAGLQDIRTAIQGSPFGSGRNDRP